MPSKLPIKIILAVTNDLHTDQRLHKVCISLLNEGYNVTLVGAVLKNKAALSRRPYHTHRLPVFFKKGKLFYLEFQLRLFFFLLFTPHRITTSNDLDTLPACFLASKIKRTVLIYDSHEYFTEMAEVASRPFTKSLWENCEKIFFPRLRYVSTVNQTIADIYTQKYNVPISVIRNFPLKGKTQSNGQQNTILYQGMVKRGRGIPLAIAAMEYLPQATLKIVGGGKDFFDEMITWTSTLAWKERVIFTGLIPFEALPQHTAEAKIGLCLEEEDGLNPTLALPNKLTDYIACGVPVIASDLPEIGKIVREYNVGLILDERTPRALANLITQLLTDDARYAQIKNNCKQASGELTWEKENKILIELYQKALAGR